MIPRLPSFSAAGFRGRSLGLSLDVREQTAMWLLILVNVAVVAASFALENLLMPWKSRMELHTSGWSFVLAQAATIGFVIAAGARSSRSALLPALLAATLLGYAYLLGGLWVLDPRRAIQHAYLIFRAVELGMVCMAAMLLGAVVKSVLRQQLVTSEVRCAKPGVVSQYSLADLLLLMSVFAITLGVVNLFLDNVARENRLGGIALTIAQVLPAALPWVWGVTQRKLLPSYLAVILLLSVGFVLFKAVAEYALTYGEFAAILEQAGWRAAAYAIAATLNGLALRGLGFYWCRV